MAVPGELEFYRSASGLASGTLADHKAAYFRGKMPGMVGSRKDLELAYYRSVTGLVGGFDAVRLAYFAGLSGLTSGDVSAHMAKVFASGGPAPAPPDVTAPTPGTVAGSAITQTTFTLTASGAADETALHAQPYAFSTDNGASWSAYQTSPIFNVTGKVASTGYTCKARVRDAAGNTADTAGVVVTTSAPAALVGTYQTNAVDAADLTTYTFLAQAIGAASATRRVVVPVLTNSARAVVSVTIGGVAATIDKAFNAAGVGTVAFASAVVPTGTTADVVVTLDGVGLGCGIGVWSLSKGAATGQFAQSTGADPVPLTVTTLAGDFVIAYSFTTGVGTALFVWTGATERFEIDVYSSTTTHSGADVVAAGASTVVSVDVSATTSLGLAVAYR